MQVQQWVRSRKFKFLWKVMLKGRLRISAHTVYDIDTDLTWQRCAHGTESQGCCCTSALTFDQAVGKDWRGNWRLPSIEELQTLLIEQQPDGYHIDTVAFPHVVQDTPLWYWSRTHDGPLLAQAVNFYYGRALSGGRNIQNAVMLVRGGR